jgi:eukaryotic-like serine/threonine-protein kinase
MTVISDAAVGRLKRLGTWPEFGSSRYTVLEEIGRGGMGTVYLARDEELGREIAIKVPNAIASATLERRLQTEARVLASLEHPGIVPIHDVGRLVDGRLFYVMKRVNGRTLRDELRVVSEVTDRLRIFERICDPVAFAHAQGLIHRDLKPDNIMIGAFGEVMVMDWGTVKVGAPLPTADARLSTADSRLPTADSRLTTDDCRSIDDCRLTDDCRLIDDSDATTAGTVMGTRGFMAPEQARGAVDEIDRRTDVYGLGAILFLLLTNDVLDQEADVHGALRRRGVARPLTAICAKALAPDAAARYQSVAALAADVAAFRAGRAIDAYRESAVERLARFGRTYRTAIVLVLAYMVMRALVAWIGG